VKERRDPALPDFDDNGPVYPGTKYFYNEETRPAGASSEPGQTTRTVDSWERSRWVRLDAAGRLAEVIEPNPEGGAGLQTKYTYNVLGKLIKTEQGNQVRRFRYDSLGRLTHQKLAETEATLNLSGQWDTTTNVNDRWSEVFTYDERSNLISKTDARGVKTTFKYTDNNNSADPLNRLQSVAYDLSGVPASLTVLPAATVTYQYRTKSSSSDTIDITQLKQVDAAGVSTEAYDYDIEGRVQEYRITLAGRPEAMKTTYAYDELGRISQLTYPQQYHDNVSNPIRKTVIPNYDSAGRIAGLKVGTIDYASQITYNAASQVTSMLIGSGPNQLTETYTYDDRSALLTRQSVTRGGTTLMDYSYGYKGFYCDTPGSVCFLTAAGASYTGQLTLVTNNGPIGEWKRQTFKYDELGRLKTAQQYSWIQHVTKGNPIEISWEQRTYWLQNYSYDRYGNRMTVTASNSTGSPVAQDGSASLTFDTASNRITSSGFAYDPAGNQLQNNTSHSFVYDAAGRLVKVKSGTATVATYTYGSSNRRLITQTGSEASPDKTYYVWLGNSVITEYVEQTSASMPKWSKNYIYLGGRLLATEAPNGSGEIVQYHHPDRLSTKLVTNDLDTSSFTQANLPFGTALEAESTGATNRRFTSYDRSATTGLDYAINRHYDPRQGRFTQPDPLGMAAASLADPQSLNMYSYVGNDPVNRVDPDGQFWGAIFQFFVSLFTSLKPNVINGSFTYHTMPPISVSLTPNFQNIGVSFATVGFGIRSGGHWLLNMLFQEQPNTCQRFANRVQQIANWSNSHKELFDQMARTFMSQNEGHPRDSSPSELTAAQGGTFTGEALNFLPNDGMRPRYAGVSPDFPILGEPGQIRHFVTALISASYPFGTFAMMVHETNPTGGWPFGLTPSRDMNPDAVADRALNGLGSYIYDRIFRETIFDGVGAGSVRVVPRDMTYIRRYLADEIRRDLCVE
jgi:RHS repeat-associated protein